MRKPVFQLLAVSFWLLSAGFLQGAEPGHNFARWEKEIAAYERADATNPPPPGGIEFIGSSTIARWKTLVQDLPGQPVFNRGFGGSQIVDATHFASRVIFPYAPRIVMLRAGGNDLWAGKTPEQVFADFQEFAATVRAKLPDTEIVFVGQSPSIARWRQHEQEKKLNELAAAFVRTQTNMKYIETYEIPLGADGKPRPELFVKDGLHFNADGYQLLAARVREFLAKQ